MTWDTGGQRLRTSANCDPPPQTPRPSSSSVSTLVWAAPLISPHQIPPTLGSLTRIKVRSAQMKWQLLTGLRARWAGRPNFAPKTQFSPCHPLHEAHPVVQDQQRQQTCENYGSSGLAPLLGPHLAADCIVTGSVVRVPIAAWEARWLYHFACIFGPQSLDSEPATGTLHISAFSLCYLPPPPLPLSTPASLTKEWLEETPKSPRGQGQRPRGTPHRQPAAPALRPGSETRPHEKCAPGPFHVQIMGTYFFLRTNFTEKANLGLSPFLRRSSYNMDEP